MNARLTLGCFVAATSVAISALAEEPPPAEKLFQEARVLVEANRYAEACPKLEQSYKLEPAVGTQFNLADCYEHVGRTATAFALFRQVATIARAAGKFERERSANERAGALEPRLPRLHLVATSPAPGLELRVDDSLVDASAASNSLPIDPGPHRLHASAPGRTAWEARLLAEPGVLSEVTVPELIDASAVKRGVAADPSSAPPQAQRTIALVTGGVGIAALAIGAVAGAIALSDRSAGERACPRAVYHFQCPTEEGAQKWNAAGTAGDVSTVAFVIGGVALAAAAVLWLTAPRARTRVGATPGGLRVEGTF